MALLGANKSDKRKTNNGIFRLKIVVEKLQRSFTFPRRTSQSFCDSDLMMDSNTTSKYGLREDIKKGHFSVIAIDNGNAKRFVVPLSYLNNPSFLRLLEQAAGRSLGLSMRVPSVSLAAGMSSKTWLDSMDSSD